MFLNTTVVRSSAISRSLFQTEVTDAINLFVKQVPGDFRRGFLLNVDLARSNFLPTAYNNDWLLEYGNASNSYLLRSIPRTFTNTTCNCAVSSACQQHLRIGPPDVVLPGLAIGCLIIDGLRMSTLECFFSSDCVGTIIQFLDYYTELDGSPPLNFVSSTVPSLGISPLDNSTTSRFVVTTPIGTLIDALFIERWVHSVSYEKYFATCAPTTHVSI
jgi:hypothetical protein